MAEPAEPSGLIWGSPLTEISSLPSQPDSRPHSPMVTAHPDLEIDRTATLTGLQRTRPQKRKNTSVYVLMPSIPWVQAAKARMSRAGSALSPRTVKKGVRRSKELHANPEATRSEHTPRRGLASVPRSARRPGEPFRLQWPAAKNSGPSRAPARAAADAEEPDGRGQPASKNLRLIKSATGTVRRKVGPIPWVSATQGMDDSPSRANVGKSDTSRRSEINDTRSSRKRPRVSSEEMEDMHPDRQRRLTSPGVVPSTSQSSGSACEPGYFRSHLRISSPPLTSADRAPSLQAPESSCESSARLGKVIYNEIFSLYSQVQPIVRHRALPLTMNLPPRSPCTCCPGSETSYARTMNSGCKLRGIATRTTIFEANWKRLTESLTH
jgi:hypothetical protein